MAHGVVEEFFIGRDDIVRVATLRVGRGYTKHPIQHLCSLELLCDRNPTPCNNTPLNPTAVEFRPRRDPAVAARQRIQAIVVQDT